MELSSSTEKSIRSINQPPNDLKELIQLIHQHRTKPISNLQELLIQSPQHILACLPINNNPPDQDHHKPNDPEDVLDQIINPHLDPLAYFHILSCRLENYQSTIDLIKTLSHAHQFCHTIDRDQLHLLCPTDSSDLYSFVQHLIRCSSSVGQLKNSIEPLVKLIKTYAPINILTPLHHQLLKISLQCRSIDAAVELTNLDIDIDQEKYPIRYQDHLIYHYLAGTVQALNQNYRRAIHLLTIAVSAPGASISQIQLEAYKKLILISLLSSSSPPVLPPYTNPYLKPAFKAANHSKAYLDFMTDYESVDSTRNGYAQLIAMAEKNVTSFQKDNNLGLVKLCIESLPKKAIKKLTPIYTSIPIKLLNSTLKKNLPGVDAGALVRSMIESGELKGRLDRTTDVVDFEDVDDRGGAGELEARDSHDDRERRTQEVLRAIVGRVQSTEAEIRRTSAEIESNREFLRRLTMDVKLMTTTSGGPNDLKSTSAANTAGAHDFFHPPNLTTPAATDGGGGGSLDGHSLAHDPSFNGMMMIEEDLAVDVGMAWDD